MSKISLSKSGKIHESYLSADILPPSIMQHLQPFPHDKKSFTSVPVEKIVPLCLSQTSLSVAEFSVFHRISVGVNL